MVMKHCKWCWERTISEESSEYYCIECHNQCEKERADRKARLDCDKQIDFLQNIVKSFSWVITYDENKTTEIR